MTSFKNASDSCGVIFDAESARKQISELEVKINAPEFWQDQEKAQSLLQQRKHREERANADAALTGKASALEIYFHLAREESNSEQRDSILEDLAKELAGVDSYLAGLETKTLMAGESDSMNAIVTIKPGAGGTESQDW